MNTLKPLAFILTSLLLNGCNVWQAYTRPAVEVPSAYKEAPPAAGWKTASPGSPSLPASWWTQYQDSRLTELMTQATQANFTIQIAEANYRQGLALARASRAPLLPSVNGQAGAMRGRSNSGGSATDYSIGVNASWEIDLWGRIRQSILAGEANAEATAADLAAVRLSIQSTLAQTYFQLRILDSQKLLLDNTAQSFERSLKLTINRYNVGLASRTEIAQAETQLRNTRTQAIDITASRAQLEHAIAVLVGKPPSAFSLAASPYLEVSRIGFPVADSGLPSSLLERRPDIAAAERRMAQANAQIGIARAALFPTLSLGAAFGYSNTSLGNLLSLPNRIWSLGPTLAGPLFDNQLRKSQTEAAIARYDATVASYRQTVINGFREVEDNLALLRILEAEAIEQETAVKFAREAVVQTENRYRAGISEYQSVVIVQSTLLTAERNLLSITGRRLNASVALMTALGGEYPSLAARGQP